MAMEIAKCGQILDIFKVKNIKSYKVMIVSVKER